MCIHLMPTFDPKHENTGPCIENNRYISWELWEFENSIMGKILPNPIANWWGGEGVNNYINLIIERSGGPGVAIG